LKLAWVTVGRVEVPDHLTQGRFARKLFRIFIDEVGHHDLKSSDDDNERFLSLTGVIMRLSYETGEFTAALNKVKQEIFGRPDVVLHRRHLMDALEPPYHLLKDMRVRERFNELILELLASATYRVFTVVIDKKEHKKRYAVWRFHPYHYCLTVTLERYVQWLSRVKVAGDVMVESRGKKENMQLERAFRHIYENGTEHVPRRLFQEQLTSQEIKIKPKAANIAGLQIADLIANPSRRDLICEKSGVEMTADFSRQIVQILKKNKYLKNPFNGNVTGWGTKWLP
jgi:hypothetical protein